MFAPPKHGAGRLMNSRWCDIAPTAESGAFLRHRISHQVRLTALSPKSLRLCKTVPTLDSRLLLVQVIDLNRPRFTRGFLAVAGQELGREGTEKGRRTRIGVSKLPATTSSTSPTRTCRSHTNTAPNTGGHVGLGAIRPRVDARSACASVCGPQLTSGSGLSREASWREEPRAALRQGLVCRHGEDPLCGAGNCAA